MGMKVALLVCVLAICNAVPHDKLNHNERFQQAATSTHSDAIVALLEKAAELKDAFKTFFCTDAVTFAGNKKSGFTLAGQPNGFQDFQTSAPITIQGQDHDAIVKLGNKIYDTHGGCCTTLALAMFAKLAPTADTKGPRIEIISVGQDRSNTHVFLVAGRDHTADDEAVLPKRLPPRNGAKNGNYPDHENWGDNAVVIDAWLMSLGWNGISLEPAKDGSKDDAGETFGFDGGVLLFEKPEVV